jgi:hypothetical protein
MQQLAQHVTMKRQVRRIAGLVDYRKKSKCRARAPFYLCHFARLLFSALTWPLPPVALHFTPKAVTRELDPVSEANARRLQCRTGSRAAK